MSFSLDVPFVDGELSVTTLFSVTPDSIEYDAGSFELDCGGRFVPSARTHFVIVHSSGTG